MEIIKRLTISAAVLLSCFMAIAQPEMQQTARTNYSSGTVTGSIVDANGVPLEYASVNVKKTSDSTTVQYGITDSNGKFTLENIPFGEYFVEIQYIGYQKSTSSKFTISKSNAVFKIPKYKMTDKNTELEAVVIQAQKDMLQTNLDKTVFNVESSINATGQTAAEVLEEIPSVSVDLEGNVSLRGSENVTILVDGRATNLTMDQIPADMIESVEVITNPSARLEPDGMAGILNVVLKKKKESGFNGMVNLGGSTACVYHNEKHNIFLNGYNGSLSFNYRYDKINLFASYGYRNHSHRNGGTLWRESWDSLYTDIMEQENFGTHSDRFQNGSLSLDYYINKYNTLSFNVRGHFGKMQRDNDLWSRTQRKIDSANYSILNEYDQDGDNIRKFNAIDASLNYKKTFATPGRELTADLFFTNRNGNATDVLFQQHKNDEKDNYYQTSTTIERNRDASAQLDFVTGVGNGGRIETGYKFSYRGVGQDYHLYSGISAEDTVEDLSQRNDFSYSEYINALYFIYSNTFWSKLQMQLGLRGEVSYTVSDLKSQDMVYSYWNYNHFAKNFFYPTIHLKYEFTPEHSLQFSFSRRVQRPRIHQLNPFINYSDKENLSCGNPELEPEFANSFELGYMYVKDKTSITLTGFYRRRTNLITRNTEMQWDSLGNPYTMTTYMNYNKSQNMGVEFFFSQRVKKVWRVNVTGSFYRNIIDSDNLLDENLSRDWAWNMGVNQTFTVGKNFDLQLDFRYRSSSLTSGSMGWGTGGVGQGRRSATYWLNMGAKKGFLDNSLVVSLNIRNILYFIPKVRQMQVQSWQNCAVYDEYYEPNAGSTGYYSYSLRENEGFNISLNVTYKLNNYKNRQQKSYSEEEYSGSSDM